VQENLRQFLPETFLPLARTEVTRWRKTVCTVVPLFPSYLFACLDLELAYHKVQRTAGVVGLVCTGKEPAEVDPRIVAEVKSRGTNGIVEITKESFRPGQFVCVTDGPLRGFEAVFESYMSGTERVAVLLANVCGNVRVVMPAAHVGGRCPIG
jgi:transcriptional antiterminator RfaH